MTAKAPAEGMAEATGKETAKVIETIACFGQGDGQSNGSGDVQLHCQARLHIPVFRNYFF